MTILIRVGFIYLKILSITKPAERKTGGKRNSNWRKLLYHVWLRYITANRGMKNHTTIKKKISYFFENIMAVMDKKKPIIARITNGSVSWIDIRRG
jgi:hypothetical protein